MTSQDPIALFRLELSAAAQRRLGSSRRRRSFLLPAGLAFAAIVVTGTALAATGWLTGSPAPQSVNSDFQSYPPQLGSHPDSGASVLVASNGDMTLYATTDAEGSYCVVASTPWKRPRTLPDGGTCVPPADAAAPFVAGEVAAQTIPIDEGNASTLSTLVIAGRTADTDASEVSFTAPNGNLVTAQVGSSGFFIASVQMPGSPCAGGDWKPTFTVLDASGNQIDSRQVLLIQADQGVCSSVTYPHP